MVKDLLILGLVLLVIFLVCEYIRELKDMENLLDDYKNHVVVSAEYETMIEPYKGLIPDEIFSIKYNKKLKEKLGAELIDKLIEENALIDYKFKEPCEVEYNHNPNDIRKEQYLKIVIQVDARKKKED